MLARGASKPLIRATRAMAAAASTDAGAKMQVAVDPKGKSFNRTGLRIKDPSVS